MVEQTVQETESRVKVTTKAEGVKVTTSRVFSASPGGKTSTSEPFTRGIFEAAVDKVSRPTGRGKLAHLRPNSEEFARRKQEEIDLEERQR